jgi:hypothetical protein
MQNMHSYAMPAQSAIFDKVTVVIEHSGRSVNWRRRNNKNSFEIMFLHCKRKIDGLTNVEDLTVNDITVTGTVSLPDESIESVMMAPTLYRSGSFTSAPEGAYIGSALTFHYTVLGDHFVIISVPRIVELAQDFDHLKFPFPAALVPTGNASWFQFFHWDDANGGLHKFSIGSISDTGNYLEFQRQATDPTIWTIGDDIRIERQTITYYI